jgi:osmotically-inducible protein OsmY
MKRYAGLSLILILAALAFSTGCSTLPAGSNETLQAPSDSQLGRDVMSRLEQDSLAGRHTFGVIAKNGEVTIRGAVPNEGLRVRVLGIVRGTPGVVSVVDELRRW